MSGFDCLSPGEWAGREKRCWRCLGCRSLRAWVRSLKLRLEAAGHDDRVWLCTLTLKEELSDAQAYPLVQKWLKRARKYFASHGLGNARYCCVCEYGSRNGRIHYHIVLFVGDAVKYRSLPEWSHGFHHFRLVSGGAASRYVTKYVLKSPRVKVRASQRLGASIVNQCYEHDQVLAALRAFTGAKVVSIAGVRVPREMQRTITSIDEVDWSDRGECIECIGIPEDRWSGYVEEFKRRKPVPEMTDLDLIEDSHTSSLPNGLAGDGVVGGTAGEVQAVPGGRSKGVRSYEGGT